jgi:hypothetical protein
LVARTGFAGSSITLFAVYLFVRDPHDLNMKAAGTVIAAIAVQAVWAPLIFLKISFLLLQTDAGVVGWLVVPRPAGSEQSQAQSGPNILTGSGYLVRAKRTRRL